MDTVNLSPGVKRQRMFKYLRTSGFAYRMTQPEMACPATGHRRANARHGRDDNVGSHVNVTLARLRLSVISNCSARPGTRISCASAPDMAEHAHRPLHVIAASARVSSCAAYLALSARTTSSAHTCRSSPDPPAVRTGSHSRKHACAAKGGARGYQAVEGRELHSLGVHAGLLAPRATSAPGCTEHARREAGRSAALSVPLRSRTISTALT